MIGSDGTGACGTVRRVPVLVHKELECTVPVLGHVEQGHAELVQAEVEHAVLALGQVGDHVEVAGQAGGAGRCRGLLKDPSSAPHGVKVYLKRQEGRDRLEAVGVTEHRRLSTDLPVVRRRMLVCCHS